MKRILIIDDELVICKLLSRFLQKNGYETTIATTGKQGLMLLKQYKYSLVLCDYHLGDISGEQIFEKIRKKYSDTIIIFISGSGNIPIAVNLVKEGAFQFLTKPLFPDIVLETIEAAFIENGTPTKNTFTSKPEKNDISGYVKGRSPVANDLFERINLVGPTDYNVIIHGETGTGKEALAGFLHQSSNRKDKPFITIDCGCFSNDLAASELFGYKKGAFTGADEDKIGAFELADTGTLFLDEVGNLSPKVQMLLLRALQEKAIRKVGDLKEKNIDVRIIVASNESIPELIEKNRFREDLYYRLNEFTLEVPALRNREADLPLFISEFIKESASRLQKNIKGLDPEAENLIYAYSWPGNIRELQNVIKRACLLTPDNGFIESKILPLELIESKYEKNEKRENNEGLKEVTLRAEKEKILTVLKDVNYNKTKAAQQLEIDRKTLYNKLREFEILKTNQ